MTSIRQFLSQPLLEAWLLSEIQLLFFAVYQHSFYIIYIGRHT